MPKELQDLSTKVDLKPGFTIRSSIQMRKTNREDPLPLIFALILLQNTFPFSFFF